MYEKEGKKEREKGEEKGKRERCMRRRGKK